MQTLAALFITLLLYVLLTASSLGWGRLLARFLEIQANGPDGGFGEVWLGWCGVLLLLQACHYLVPLTIYPCAGIYGFGLFLLAWSRPAPGVCLTWKDRLKNGAVAWCGFLFFAIWVALQAMKAPSDYDSGLYHFNAIRWINEYAIVPGLGNLHNRLAFNQAYFPFVASLNFYPWFDHGHNVAISWLLLLTTAQCLFYFSRVWRALWNTREPLVGDLLPALLFPYLLYAASKMGLSSPQPDNASFLVRLMLFIYLWRNLTAESKEEIFIPARLLLILGITAITLKLSNLIFAGTICLVSILRCYGGENVRLWSLSKDLSRALLLSLVIFLVWMGRGVMTSGYPFFPSTALGFHTDWTITPDAAKHTAASIYSWARWPGSKPELVLNGWRWLGPWSARLWKSDKVEVILPVAIFLVASLAATCSLVKGTPNHRPLPWLYFGVLPVLAGLLFWFYLAPDPRFAEGLFWLLPLAVLCPYVMSQAAPEAKRKGAIALLTLMALPLILGTEQMLKQDFRFSDAGWKPIKTATLEEKVTAEGLKIHVPVDSDQCWDSPLPSTPYFSAALQLRGPGLQSGFKTLAGNRP